MLPAVDAALIPRDVRAAGPEARERYTAALGFEQMLVGELTKVLARTALPEEGESGATALYRDLLPGALATGLVSGGGIGLARDLYRAMEARA